MGKAKSGKKIYESLSKVVKGLSKSDAEKILDKVDTPEKAVALTGDARAEYQNALDVIYGPKNNRMKDMGFGSDDWFHGTSKDIQIFEPKAGSGSQTNLFGKGVYLTQKPEIASEYAKNNASVLELLKDDGFLRTIEPIAQKHGLSANEFVRKASQMIERGEYITPKMLQGFSDLLEKADEFNQIGGNVLPLKIRSENSFDLKNNWKKWDNLRGDAKAESRDAARLAVQNLGFDSIIDSDQISVFDPKHIRSKYAAFDPRFKDSPLLMAGTAGAVMGTTMLPEESEASMGKFNSLKKMWQVGDKAFPAANAAEALKVQKAMETKGMVPHGKVLVEAKGTVPVANKPISNMARGIAVPGALGIDSTGSDVLKSGMQGVLDAFGAYRQNIVEPVANKLKETLTPKLNIQGQQYDTASPVSDMALDIAADPLTYAGGGAGAGLGALDMATSFGEESPKRNYEGLKAILNKK